jgi:hypothetical protein
MSQITKKLDLCHLCADFLIFDLTIRVKLGYEEGKIYVIVGNRWVVCK